MQNRKITALKNENFAILNSALIKGLKDKNTIMYVSELADAANLLRNYITDAKVTTCKDIDFFLNNADYDSIGSCN